AAGGPVGAVGGGGGGRGDGGGTTGDPADANVYVGTEAVLHRVTRADVVAFLELDAELFAPRFRAAEHAIALIARAARMVGPRSGGGRLVLQTFSPDHEVVRAAVFGDPGRMVEVDGARRRALGLPPYGALAEVAGAGAADLVVSLAGTPGVEVGGGPDRWVVRSDDPERLGSALRAAPRPPGSRLRVAVDPPRA
ncbi:MAG: hypothetical protein WD225_02565, partial [Ilumatobacteraceae bacterium]